MMDDMSIEIPNELKGCPGTGRWSDPISGSGFVLCSYCGSCVPGSSVDGTALPHERPPTIYLPGDMQLMAARGAICGYIDSIANGNLTPSGDVLDTIIKAVAIALRWQPASQST